MKAKLTKLKSNHTQLRTDVIEGMIPLLPKVGLSFSIYAKPLDEAADVRIVTTTPIEHLTEVSEDLSGESGKRVWAFDTANSTYRLELLDET